eukprot:3306181-Prymnesium_polylepis.1
MTGVYKLGGVTGNGSPFYVHSGGLYSIYYDLDCSGSGWPAQWTLDSEPPDATRSSDLDNDGGCYRAANLMTPSAELPLGAREWEGFCGDG